MAALLRMMVLGMGVGFMFCVFMSRTTGDPIWRQRGMNILKWAVVLGLIAFGGIILRRAAVFI